MQDLYHQQYLNPKEPTLGLCKDLHREVRIRSPQQLGFVGLRQAPEALNSRPLKAQTERTAVFRPSNSKLIHPKP